MTIAVRTIMGASFSFFASDNGAISRNKTKPVAYLQTSTRLCGCLKEKNVVRARERAKRKRGYLTDWSFFKASPRTMIQRAEKTRIRTKCKEPSVASGSTQLEEERAKGRKKINMPSRETIRK